MSNDYIPESDGKFLGWVKNLFTEVELSAVIWNLNPGSWAHINPPLIMRYETALTKAHDPNRGKADVRAKNDARNLLKKETRQYVNEFLKYNPRIHDEDRVRIGLPVYDRKPTPVGTPETMPLVVVKILAPGVLEFNVKDSKSRRKAKPAGIHGFEVRWAILDAPPLNWEQLAYSSFATHTPLRLSFSGNERGKTLYFALRWENTRGVKGPWTEIMNTIIP
jgi:hypothetical protein